MISTSREADFAAKPQGNQDNNTADHQQHGKNPKTAVPSTTTTTTSSWSKLKDPRIVRVSRAFGGKDRHSKVCTVRGLRDRRVRLSVPTAIQLYDLQEKLGLNQPSKVVDWLLNAAKDEIDELPPLQMPPGNFSLISHDAVQAAVLAQSSQKELRNVNKSVDWDDPLGLQRPNFWNTESMKSKEVEMERVEGSETRDDDEEDGNDGNHHHHQNVASTSNFFPRSNHDVAPYNPFYRLNSPMNFSLGSHGFSNHPPPNHQTDQDLHNLNVFQLQQPRSQSLMFPSGGMTAQPYFPAPNSLDHHHHQYDTKQIKQFQMMGSNSENPFLPFQLSMAPSLLARSDHHDHNGGGDHHQNHSSNNNNCE